MSPFVPMVSTLCTDVTITVEQCVQGRHRPGPGTKTVAQLLGHPVPKAGISVMAVLAIGLLVFLAVLLLMLGAPYDPALSGWPAPPSEAPTTAATPTPPGGAR